MTTQLVGINYERGKIIDHIQSLDGCIYYANCQVCMDAPFKEIPRLAGETVRNIGRSECQFDGYDEVKLVESLCTIFEFIRTINSDNLIKLVIQIARGRAAESTARDIILPILAKFDIANFHIVHGYRSSTYFTPADSKERFIFLNYGMFAELSDVVGVNVGEICNPVTAYNITSYDNSMGFTIDEHCHSYECDEKNILNRFSNLKSMIIFGIGDDMPFVTPDKYRVEHAEKILAYQT